MKSNLSTTIRLLHVASPTAAGTSSVTTSSVDMAQDGGYDGVLFLSAFGTPATNNNVYGRDSDDNSTFNDINASTTAPGASDAFQYLDIVIPQHRYVESVWQRGTSTTLGDVWALLYRSHHLPIQNIVSGVMNGKLLINPADGTH
jgi:hypothetical protein